MHRFIVFQFLSCSLLLSLVFSVLPKKDIMKLIGKCTYCYSDIGASRALSVVRVRVCWCSCLFFSSVTTSGKTHEKVRPCAGAGGVFMICHAAS